MTDTLIIGGGAAGMAAGIFEARNGGNTLIVEKNAALGKKLAITGKGRCNLTNNCSADEFMKNIFRNPKFIYSALSNFSPADCMDFFEGLGVPLKTERGGRVFPVSDKASDVVSALERELKRLDVKIETASVKKIILENGKAVGAETDKGKFYAQKTVLAAGGASYKATGSDGSGFRLARAVGHTITPLSPALVPLETVEDCSEMSGLTVKNALFTVKKNKKTIFSEQGEFTFESYGAGGPLSLKASCLIEAPRESDYEIVIDLKPALSFEKLDKRILREISENGKASSLLLAKKLLPEKLTVPVLKRANISPETRCAEISKEKRKLLCETLKGFTLKVKDLRPLNEAIITKGGVDVREINPKNMRSLLAENLYFAGEVIDVSGFTGGFNLHLAFAQAKALTLFN